MIAKVIWICEDRRLVLKDEPTMGSGSISKSKSGCWAIEVITARAPRRAYMEVRETNADMEEVWRPVKRRREMRGFLEAMAIERTAYAASDGGL